MKKYINKRKVYLYKSYALLTSYEGEPVGLSVDGASVGELLGLREGLAVGLAVTGDDEGLAVGSDDSLTGDIVGEFVTAVVGLSVATFINVQ